ncbi:hypothetical protein F8154_13460 [Alkaliphilus pronyensis]|uniref:Uncharacterized protein n=1 Tax=Alkaliphilus pronyensis TaxID=1482732 RepID=A0A6I0EYR4_9FIRM|nr:hypothetical protein [Alkaliphilus pronyensis]KAB3530922.1 hypothetical protein F8154_13460 [Alkaliphilus pronyensis]
MNKRKALTVLLILLIVVNIFIINDYYDIQMEKTQLEKAIIMNEFSERAKAWRNFIQFTGNLSSKKEKYFPIAEEESKIHWELAKPMESIIVKVTDKVNPNYSSYSEYLMFLEKFDLEYEAIINLFKLKLPSMSKDQVISFSSQLDEAYSFFIGEAIGEWTVGGDGYLDIKFEPAKDKLNLVIEMMILIKEEIESI